VLQALYFSGRRQFSLQNCSRRRSAQGHAVSRILYIDCKARARAPGGDIGPQGAQIRNSMQPAVTEAVPPVSGMLAQPALSSEKLPASADLSELKAMNAKSSEGPRVRNQDKRTSRIANRDSFIGAIQAQRETMAASVGSAAPDKGVAVRGIHVCVRKRPLFPHEDAAGDYDTTTVSGHRMAVHDGRMKPDMVHMEMKHTTYTFPRVFDENDSNDTVYESAAGPLVRHAAQGGTATMFMFGQTGSGKTYTMSAIHERAVQELFEQLDGSEMVVVSYVELAGSSCRDLLNGGGAVDLLSDKHGEVQLRGVTELEAHDHVQLLQVMTAANNSRATSATGVHDQSSRSHAVCRVSIRRPSGSNGTYSGNIYVIRIHHFAPVLGGHLMIYFPE
jgi:hypothetical protein